MLVTHGTRVGTAAGTPVPAEGGLALTVGNFDGVHRGHQAMLLRLKEKATQLGVPACVLTFEPHPREFFAPHAAPARLTRLAAKLQVLRDSGVDRVHVARFDANFAALPPARFVEDILAKGLGCVWLLVGRDFRFGAKRAGDFALLEDAGQRLGMRVEAMPEVQHAGTRISSSDVRRALEQGDLEYAALLLGRPYSIAGRVARGDRLGRELGFATANIRLPQWTALAGRTALAGIFVVEVFGVQPAPKEGSPGVARAWPGVASLGVRPTVSQEAVPLLEVHLFDFAGELYGRRLEVKFLHKLRDEEKFPDLEALRNAIAADAANARKFFAARAG